MSNVEHIAWCSYVNAPWLFRTIYAIAKPVINANTRKKVKVLGSSDDEVVIEMLINAVGKKFLYKEYGGELADLRGLKPHKELIFYKPSSWF